VDLSGRLITEPELQESFRTVCDVVAGVRGSSVTPVELHCEPRPQGRV
jgi:hypothetical protein